MKNKIIIGFALTLLLFISSIALASYAYQPRTDYQSIYDIAVQEEKACYESIEENPERIGECVAKRISRIDKTINLANWKKTQTKRLIEHERLTQVIAESEKEKREIIDFTRAL